MILAAGDRLGPYEILGPLGAGGMGEVCKARDSRLDREVAIKVLPEHLAHDPAALSRFEREAKAVAAISHPNILAIHDFGREGGVTFAVMELLEGETLRSRLSESELAWREAVEIGTAVADGLAAAHSRGIVHRDLKPENVFLTSDGRVKILDFGLARREKLLSPVEHTEAPTMTQETVPGTVMGTVGYMAPEQVIGQPGDARSDIFSFGCVLYEMAAGQRAFSGRTGVETLSAILKENPPDLAQSGREIPGDLSRVIMHCLKKEPEQRCQSARDLCFDLRAILAGAAVSAPTVPRETRRPRVPWRAFAAGVAVVLLLGAALWIRRSRHSSGAAAGAIQSLAVLPFENASKDADAEYLSDGLTESLIDQMSRVSSLKVMARATVFRFKGTADPQDAGRKLGVGAVLTGSLSRRTNRLLISAELVEIPTGARLWGEKYDRPLADLLRVQDSMAMEVSHGLRLRLSEQERRALSRHGTDNPEAYELFLKARDFFVKGTEEGLLEGRRLYLQAAEKDPKFADAHLGAAAAYAGLASDGFSPPAEVWPPFDKELRKALDLDPGSVRASLLLAVRRWHSGDWDWKSTEQEFQQLASDSRLLAGEQFGPIAVYFWSRGRTEEAVALMEKALRVDPGNFVAQSMKADFLAQAGRLDEAIGVYKTAIESEPSDPRALFGLADALKRRHDMAGAVAALRKAYELSGEETGAKALAAARTEKDYEKAEAAVARARLGELEALARERYVSPLDFARLYAQVGEREKAFASLEAAFAERSPGLVYLKVDRAWDRIRDDARFAALVRRVGIP
ncbi:MAG TPA: protein kinase [Thermoanaerobaculia bacterium]